MPWHSIPCNARALEASDYACQCAETHTHWRCCSFQMVSGYHPVLQHATVAATDRCRTVQKQAAGYKAKQRLTQPSRCAEPLRRRRGVPAGGEADAAAHGGGRAAGECGGAARPVPPGRRRAASHRGRLLRLAGRVGAGPGAHPGRRTGEAYERNLSIRYNSSHKAHFFGA